MADQEESKITVFLNYYATNGRVSKAKTKLSGDK